MTKFTRVEAQPTQEDTNPLMPYTNKITLSTKICDKPTKKIIGSYEAVSCSIAHWQPRGKPTLFLQMLCYDSDVSKTALSLDVGKSIVVTGKLGMDIHNGVQKLFLLCDDIQK
jgi:hypothetical protein